MTPITAVRRVQLDPHRHRFHNKAALMLTVATLVLLATLSVVFGSHKHDEQGDYSSRRWLEDADDNANDDVANDDDSQSATDFSKYSCRYIYDQVPGPGYAQCRFAQTCNGGDGVWAPFVFCHWQTVSAATIFFALCPFMLIWMVILFRLLGSTAEDYFSPSLEMFSVKLGLPPRFAGVSLLALGNGAADVSATMSAIANDPENGYTLSLGALTGAAMLVGGVIAGIVVLVAGGVPCRGALVRDVSALFITVMVVWYNLSSGEIGPANITLFLSMYAVFVCLVLVADVYHRAVVLPRLAVARATAMEGDEETTPDGADPTATPGPPSTLTRVMTAMSNYDNEQDTTTTTTTTTADAYTEGWGIASSQPQQQQQQQQQQVLDTDAPIILHGQHGILHGDGQGHSVAEQPTDTDGGGTYALVEDHMDQICAGDGSPGISASNWTGGWHDGQQEIRAQLYLMWEDVWYNGDLHPAEKFLMVFELPFTFLRKVSCAELCCRLHSQKRKKVGPTTAFVRKLWCSSDTVVIYPLCFLTASLLGYGANSL
jgi:Ca2+/Na+ antiporter